MFLSRRRRRCECRVLQHLRDFFWGIVTLPRELLWACVGTPYEWRFRRELANRPLLTDGEFYDRFYRHTGIPREIPLRLRQVYADSLGQKWLRVQPSDNAALVIQDLDFAEILLEVGEAFNMAIPLDDWQARHCSFDSVVRYLADKLRP